MGNDEALVNGEIEKILKQKTGQGSSKLEIVMKIQLNYTFGS